MQHAPAPSIGHAVDREHIDIDATHVIHVLTLDERCGGILNLGERQRIGAVVFSANHLQRFRQPFPAVRNQPVVVLARHRYVDVIIPRDEAVVSQSPNHRSRPNIIGQPVGLACLVYQFQYLQDTLVQYLYVIVCHCLP